MIIDKGTKFLKAGKPVFKGLVLDYLLGFFVGSIMLRITEFSEFLFGLWMS